MRKTILQEQQGCSVKKTAPKKLQILEKSDNFENRPPCRGYSPCKGYTHAKLSVWVKN